MEIPFLLDDEDDEIVILRDSIFLTPRKGGKIETR
jgi:hypothetical protein